MPDRTIAIVGGLTRRIIAEVNHMPDPSETVITNTYDSHTGGRGAFSAVAAYRQSHYKPTDDQTAIRCVCGKDEIFVRLIGAIGDDDIGQPMKDRISNAGVNTERVRRIPNTNTSMVFVLVDEESKANSELLCPGANHALKPGDFGTADKLLEMCGGRKPDLLVTNCELERSTVAKIVETATHAKVPVLLNLIPKEYFFKGTFRHLTHLIVHKAEARYILENCPADDDNAYEWESFAQEFLDRGVSNVVVTLGAHGAYYSSQDGGKTQGHVPSQDSDVDKIGGGYVALGSLPCTDGISFPSLC